MSETAQPTLIRWEDVKDGDVWFRLRGITEWTHGYRSVDFLWRHDMVVSYTPTEDGYEFAAAEQQPGEHADAIHYANGVADLALKHRDMAEAGLARLKAALATLDTDALIRAVEYLDKYADTVDGPDSQPVPNAAMSLMGQLDELHGRLAALREGQ